MKLSELHNLIHTVRKYGGEPDPQKFHQALQELGFEPGAIYQELEMDSRFVDTHRDISHFSSTVNLHSHNFYELLFCHNTGGTEYLVGSERYRLEQGDIILISPGISHRPLFPEHMSEPYIRDVLWISQEFMDGLIQYYPSIYQETVSYTALLRTDVMGQKLFSDLFATGVREAENRAPGWETAVIGNTIQLLSQLYRTFIQHTTHAMRAEKPELLDQVLSYIEIHLADKVTLSDVAHHFFVSESTISQIFRSKLGVSFHRCLTQRRLITAKTLIAQDNALESVSAQVGFTDYSAFYRAFKQEYGISPRQYRKLLESGDQNPAQA